MGKLLDDIMPSWASASVLALLPSGSGEPPLSAMSLTRVSFQAGGSGVMEDNTGPAGVDTPPVVDADAEWDDDPTQTFVTVDGVDPSVTDPWRALEAQRPLATLALTFPEGGSLPPHEGKCPLGDSPCNPLGVTRTIILGANSIYEYDADTLIGGRVEDSPTPVVIPNPGGLGQGGDHVPPNLRTRSRADGQGVRVNMDTTPRLSNHPNHTFDSPIAMEEQRPSLETPTRHRGSS